MILTIAVPVSMRYEANQFARCIGQSEADELTFAHGPNTKDSEGNLYILSSGWTGPRFVETATSVLQEPAWGCDLEAAQRAQSVVQMDSVASPASIAVWALGVNEALTTMGLTMYQEEIL